MLTESPCAMEDLTIRLVRHFFFGERLSHSADPPPEPLFVGLGNKTCFHV